MKMFRYACIASLLLVGINGSAQQQVAITIDDLPCSNCADDPTILSTNKKILDILNRYNIESVGFVNEGKCYRNEKPDSSLTMVLEDWLRRGQELGNHTYSHISIGNVTVQEYEADLLKGEVLMRPMISKYNGRLKYFRHTQLRTGPTKEYKEQLEAVLYKHGYTTAPVTIDNDEYIYAYCYTQAKRRGDTTLMRMVAYDYLDYMRTIIRHMEKLSDDFLGEKIPHILLIHANELNAEYLDDLLEVFIDRSYTFITLDKALEHPVYRRKAAQTNFGFSWLYRWQLAEGQKITYAPDLSSWVQELFDKYADQQDVDKRHSYIGDQKDLEIIFRNIRKFSASYKSGDVESLVNCYTEDAKLFAHRMDIVANSGEISQFWKMPEDMKVLHHLVTPVEIVVSGDTAYDWGYYEGETQSGDGKIVPWSGKYVIVWKKVGGDWKIYLDSWNRL
jgi:ketosteroid isomerase-like protein/peptidoglycan/xylan/chitin deacetylase (PgdA/CDA1 family)